MRLKSHPVVHWEDHWWKGQTERLLGYFLVGLQMLHLPRKTQLHHPQLFGNDRSDSLWTIHINVLTHRIVLICGKELWSWIWNLKLNHDIQLAQTRRSKHDNTCLHQDKAHHALLLVRWCFLHFLVLLFHKPRYYRIHKAKRILENERKHSSNDDIPRKNVSMMTTNEMLDLT